LHERSLWLQKEMRGSNHEKWVYHLYSKEQSKAA